MNKTIETDILCIGAGVASLSTALHLMRTLKKNGAAAPSIMVIEKGRAVGSHVLSGAVMDPSGLKALLSDEEFVKMPVESKVGKEAMAFLLPKSAIKVPWIPPLMRAHEYPLVSLTKVTRYLADICEKEGIAVYPGFAAVELLHDDSGRVIGAQIGDKGVNHEGQPKSNYLKGEKVFAKTVVLGEGGCGILTERLIKKNKLEGVRPQTYAVAFKELIEVASAPERAGEIAHTFGFPVPDAQTYGGGFIYRMNATTVAVGYALGLDYRKADFDPHAAFRMYKNHPFVQAHIAGGKTVAYGAKVIPEGGVYSAPALATDGALIVGDSGGLLDSLRIKGIHIAVQSGIAAGATLADCWLKKDFSKAALAAYTQKVQAMPGWQEMKRVKNVRAGFTHHLLFGMMCAGGAAVLNGLFPFWRVKMEGDAEATRPLSQDKAAPLPDLPMGPLSMDRLSDVFLSGTLHEEDQPCHLKIKDRAKCKKCIELYGAPCVKFCPAEVYRIEDGNLHVDFSNCLHCKTCQIKDPLANIEWCFPTGGEGPRYTRM